MKFEITYTDAHGHQQQKTIEAAGYGTAVEQFVTECPDYQGFMIHQMKEDTK